MFDYIAKLVKTLRETHKKMKNWGNWLNKDGRRWFLFSCISEQTVVPLTMEPTSVDSNVESAVISPHSVKRTRRDTKVATGKSVVVLRTRDVRVRNDFVFMPNTIEMAQLKKQSRGQFKRNVQISLQMTETDVKHTLMELFPILEGKR